MASRKATRGKAKDVEDGFGPNDVLAEQGGSALKHGKLDVKLRMEIICCRGI